MHELTLTPRGWVQRGQITYLVACAETFDDVRLYPLLMLCLES
ncbi:hypothetical protein [Pseudomonas sp. WPR_5_2]|nr:hypothetical protein [Pseudomonas sp. WPR_5_2]